MIAVIYVFRLVELLALAISGWKAQKASGLYLLVFVFLIVLFFLLFVSFVLLLFVVCLFVCLLACLCVFLFACFTFGPPRLLAKLACQIGIGVSPEIRITHMCELCLMSLMFLSYISTQLVTFRVVGSVPREPACGFIKIRPPERNKCRWEATKRSLTSDLPTRKPQGCLNGDACLRCHLCPAGELKRRKG